MPLWWGEAPKEPTASTEASSFDRPKNVFSPENAPSRGLSLRSGSAGFYA
jgi:hypothetical protein